MSLGNIFYDAMLPLFASPSVTFINEATGSCLRIFITFSIRCFNVWHDKTLFLAAATIISLSQE